MADSTQSRVWTELARKLIERRDVRPEVKAALERALEQDDVEAAAAAARRAMADAVTREEARPAEAQGAWFETEAGRQRARARARQKRSLVEHGLRRLAAGEELVSGRLCAFLRDQLLEYAAAASEAADDALVAPQALAERVLEAVSERRVMARPLRVGILTPTEVAALASGSLTPEQAATVVSSGDVGRDIEAWRASASVDSARKQALSEGAFGDGEYLFAVIEPTAEGRRVAVHPITSAGDTSPEPVEHVAIPEAEEPVSVLQIMVEPAVRDETAPVGLEAPRLWEREADRPAGDLLGLRQAAVALNQARLNLYASILESRSDLPEAARVESERQLVRMQAESEAAASAQSPARLSAFLAKWRDELTRDMGRLFEVTTASSESLGTLARLGALRHRLDTVEASARGVERLPRNLRGAGAASLVLAQPQPEPTSIFDGLSGQTLAPAARRAAGKSVVGETLAADVVARDAARSARPSGETRQVLRAIKASGEQLRRALTTMDTLHDSGLGLSSQLRPLLRAAMPTDIRPELSSPLMRNVLLPALEQVSGPGGARARVAQRAPAAPQMTPEALYGIMLGQTGLDLVERRPEIARNVLTQIAALGQQLEAAGIGGTAGALMKAGQAIVDKVTTLLQTGEEPGHDEQKGGKQVVGEIAAEAVGVAGEAEPPGANIIDDAAGKLAGEGSELKNALKDKIAPFLPDDVPYGQKIFSGKMADLVLGEMGAAGATVGDDVYLRSDLGRDEQAAVAAHELTHVTQKRGRSIEDLEQEAYAIESKVRDFLSGVELAAERPAGGGGQQQADAGNERKEEEKNELVLEELADIIQRWRRDAAEMVSTMIEGSA